MFVLFAHSSSFVGLLSEVLLCTPSVPWDLGQINLVACFVFGKNLFKTHIQN
jgi:hypothetical protein